MTTDSERREVARRLREIRPCKSGHIEWWRIAQALGLKEPAGWFGWEKFEPDSVNRLVDLIEPSGHECVPGECPPNVRHDNDRIDQERLLALADEMEGGFLLFGSTKSARRVFDFLSDKLGEYARRIREACGEGAE